MIALNYTHLRNHMKEAFDKVSDEYETIIVTRKEAKNIVMLSEESYNNLLENVHVRAELANYEWIRQSLADAKAGKYTARELLEDE